LSNKVDLIPPSKPETFSGAKVASAAVLSGEMLPLIEKPPDL